MTIDYSFDENILEKITNCTDIYNKIILEIGPGTGNLTEVILKKNPKRFIVIEKDKNLADLLKKKFNCSFKF